MKPQKGEYYELLFMPEDNRLFQVRRFYRKYKQPWAMVRSEKLQKNFPIPVKVLKSEHCRKTEPPVKEPTVIQQDDLPAIVKHLDQPDEVEGMKKPIKKESAFTKAVNFFGRIRGKRNV
ncbi:hypothetical protein [Macrococcus bovicus]|uniref:Uncharacterized protein n=1 Tax=Macrococcus bovicus TaxID=69968 RepID=A0A4R6C3E6_9STAP|nr:hypothetical protein [Macrococcus bovicus]TDM15711.1 hypothetical protein ERX55_02050 [Macrococcus bovicus]